MSVRPVLWRDGRVALLDQRLLPDEEIWREFSDHREVAEAIRAMVVRGAPAIGCAAAMGIAVGAAQFKGAPSEFGPWMEGVFETIRSTRPTAVNLFWAVERMKRVMDLAAGRAPDEIAARLVEEAKDVIEEDLARCRAIGRCGAQFIEDGFTVLTHCNAGALATAGYGTALGVIRGAREQGKRVTVFADETRPLLQGARLTAWELMKDGIPVTLITDGMAGHFMAGGEIDCAVVGADRIARNGDTANKIGTYQVAVLARENGIPFYVAAPSSSFDMNIRSGEEIVIEERNPSEVTHIRGVRIAPEGVEVRNPAFDVTPARYITAIISEKGAARPPFEKTLPQIVEGDPSAF